MDAGVIGGAFLSAFLQPLFQRLASEDIPKLFRGNKPIVDLLDELKTLLISANKLVNDAEEKLIKDEFVRQWLDELNDAIYRADDLVDTIDAEALRRQVEGDDHSSSSTGIISSKLLQMLSIQTDSSTGFNDDMVMNEATKILGKLKSLLGQKDALGLREVFVRPSSSQRTRAPLADRSSVYGRDGDIEAIVTLLLSDGDTEENISVIPIVGMGGVGKTTLAQLAYDDNRVKEHFDLQAWVTVSDDFDIDRITKEILDKVTSKECCIGNSFELQQKLKEALRGKRFLLVHDDDWNEKYDKWYSLKSSFESGANGSKIVVTARTTTVSSVKDVGKTAYQLSYLSPEDGWQLFSKHAFGNNEDPHARQDLEKIGREIVNKCEGLPLAIKSLGVLLRSEQDPKKWEKNTEK